jgi:hypothetical protein
MAIAGGVSMLSAQVSVYDASGNLLDLQGDASAYGLNVTASVAGVVAGQRYYIKVTGATDDVFSIGSYGLEVNFEGGVPLAIPIAPVTPVPILPPVPAVVPSFTPPVAPPYVPPYSPPYVPPGSPPYVPPDSPPYVPPDSSPDTPPVQTKATPGKSRQSKKVQRRLVQPKMRRRMPRFPGGVRMQVAARPR